ncbi:armadillo-type protein [Lentinula aciculospora]|uniref:Armadillo-type protein n=1 Tax=Lentinula aciculospora TaxID=153920 RepID=A0A9W9AK88_9AGAR|nr:armadillo-type protein [Lentinula aciculospora]
MQVQLVSSHGMLAILEVLEAYQLGISAQSSSSNSSSSSPQTNAVSLPGPAGGVGRKASGMSMGMVSSLGLGSLASLGSLGLGGRSASGASTTSSSSSTTSGASLGITGSLPVLNTVTGIGGGLSAGGREVVLQLLKIVNLLVTGNIGFLESFCLIGGIPVVMGFTSKRFPAECRLEASNFIRLLCHTSVLTLQMFISCRGLKVLVDLLDEDCSSAAHAPLVAHALNGISSVFDLQSPTTKNDFCRMFVREGLLDPLSGALLNVMANVNSTSDGKAKTSNGPDGIQGAEDWREKNNGEGGMKMKIIRILLVFSQVSQSDLHVRHAVGTRKVVRRLLRACELLEPECLVLMLKAVKHLSMNVSLLDVLQNANAIEILVRILEEQASSPYSTEMSNHIFQTCFNLCRLNKSRQEEAAQAGIIPCLQRVAETQSPLKQFALPILCDMASAGKSCRLLLWQHDGLTMYLRLLEDPYFQVSALESILSWLQDEPARVEDELMKPKAIRSVLDCFATAKANPFENLLELFLKLTRMSTRMTTAFSRSAVFFRKVADRLGHNTKPVVRLNLLRILKSVCDAHPNRGILVERYGSGDGLLGVVEGLSRGGGDGAVLVRELAKEIIPMLRPGLKPLLSGSRAGSRGVTPKRMRRTASEASAVNPGTTGSAVTVGVAGGSSILSSGRNVLSPTAASKVVTTRPKTRLRDIPWQGTGRTG